MDMVMMTEWHIIVPVVGLIDISAILAAVMEGIRMMIMDWHLLMMDWRATVVMLVLVMVIAIIDGVRQGLTEAFKTLTADAVREGVRGLAQDIQQFGDQMWRTITGWDRRVKRSRRDAKSRQQQRDETTHQRRR
ncbi:MAG TPA: hypothetical protein VFS21_32185 [Roseiflexaceae bacterium]|nr:hypothetical protein [Roseiflexaceae bacterium]